jgi:hypothetical protein
MAGVILDSAVRYNEPMPNHQFTPYFENEVLRKRPYLTREMCIRVVESPLRVEPQENNRFRFWAAVPELEDRFLRVITLSDKSTIHNAFLDRRFRP